MRTLFSTASFPEKLSLPVRIALFPNRWLASTRNYSKWQYLYLFFIINIFIIASNNIIALSESNATLALTSIVWRGFFLTIFDIATLMLWIIVIDFLAQGFSYESKLFLLLKKFIGLRSLYLFLLPWTLLIWGLGLNVGYYSSVFKFTIFGIILILEFRAIQRFYQPRDDRKKTIFFLSMLLPIFTIFLLFISGLASLIL